MTVASQDVLTGELAYLMKGSTKLSQLEKPPYSSSASNTSWIRPLAEGWGWNECYYHEPYYWFWAYSSVIKTLKNRISWLRATGIKEYPFGVAPGHKYPDEGYISFRGSFDYSNQQDKNEAWRQLMENPVPFIIRISL